MVRWQVEKERATLLPALITANPRERRERELARRYYRHVVPSLVLLDIRITTKLAARQVILITLSTGKLSTMER